MKMLKVLLILACITMANHISASPPAGGSAPPRRCDIRLESWCIVDGTHVITKHWADDGIHERIWSLQGYFKPESKLFILEPNGCRQGYADTVELLSYEKDIRLDDRQMNKAVVRIKSDHSCDLVFLFPPLDGDPMEWAFSIGTRLIWGCKDQDCTPIVLSDTLWPILKSKMHEDEYDGSP